VQVVTSADPGPLSNSYLVADRPGGAALLIDGGTPTAPIDGAIAREGWRPMGLFVTHRHPDHSAHLDHYRRTHSIPIRGHAAEAPACGGFDEELRGGERFSWGELELRVLHIPGHTAGHIALAVRHGDELALFSGDTLFREGVGGTRGQGHTSFADLRHSVLEVLLAEERRTVIYPGHAGPTTVAHERRHNPFVKAWRANPPPRGVPCRVAGRGARLLLRGPDYDGGTKCWVRWPENGEEDIVAGSRVTEGPPGEANRRGSPPRDSPAT